MIRKCAPWATQRSSSHPVTGRPSTPERLTGWRRQGSPGFAILLADLLSIAHHRPWVAHQPAHKLTTRLCPRCHVRRIAKTTLNGVAA
jgi:hypothetical protein